MRRISLGILAAVGLFVVVVTGTLVLKARSARVEPVEPPSKADFRIKEVQLEEESGNVRWKLVADQAEIFEGEGRTGLRRPVVDIRQPSRSWRVRGEGGAGWRRRKDIEWGNQVVSVSDDGFRLETSVLGGQAGAQRLW